MSSGSFLSVTGLTAGYGPVEVLHGLEFTVGEGEIVVILGANGAGKTTAMRSISGMISRHGSIEFDGADISHAKPDAIVMHPGPMNRDVEISGAVADGPQSVITQQVNNGVAIRMAVLASIVGARQT